MKKILLLSLFLALFLAGCSLTIPTGKAVKKNLSPEEAKAAAEKFINDNLLPSNIKAKVNSATLEGDVYVLNLDVQGKNYTSYLTKDGGKFFQNGIDTAEYAQKNQQTASASSAQGDSQAQDVNIPKSDKPKVELFVMTYCPYGLQAEKGALPAFAALGDKIDAKVRFVHYFLHGDKEEQETYVQACVREQQTAKYDNYLQCFTEKGDSAACQTQAGVDKNKLSGCIAAKAKDYYKSDSALSQQYGVQGSPTLVINGAQSSAGRDSASYLSAICSAFNNKPAECDRQLSSAQPAPGFGAGTTAAGTPSGGGCASATPPKN